MRITNVQNINRRPLADLLVLPFYQKRGSKSVAASTKALFQKETKKTIELGDFKGRLGELFIVHPERQKEPRLALLGLGKESQLTVESLRKSYAALTRFCHVRHLKKINVLFPELKKITVESTLKGVCEGLLLANYLFTKLKGTSKKVLEPIEVCRIVGLESTYKSVLEKTMSICEGVNLARDLVNENADTMNADKLSEIALGFAKTFKKVSTVVFDKKRLEKEHLKLMLAVNRGTSLNPALIMVNYKGNPKDKEATVLVGKGITYDSGGIQLKASSGSIIHMKCDMGGAAAVLGILHAAAKLDLPLNIIGVVPACENAISDTAYKPGDVYESYLGKTVEILSTDAEGRLVLADALAYAEKHLNPSCMIDLATLTGGVMAALGNEITGLMSNSKKLAKKLCLSGDISGEKVWELPLYENYKVALKSNIADLKNTAGRSGYPSGVVAGLFLQEFVKSTPWAHLDIAGTAYIGDPRDYHSTKATGVGVRLILAFLEDLIDSQGEF